MLARLQSPVRRCASSCVCRAGRSIDILFRVASQNIIVVTLQFSQCGKSAPTRSTVITHSQMGLVDKGCNPIGRCKTDRHIASSLTRLPHLLLRNPTIAYGYFYIPRQEYNARQPFDHVRMWLVNREA
jgi:hypothetical protein